MQQDRFSQMENLALEITSLLQQLASKIGSLCVLCIQELRDQRKKTIEVEDKQADLGYIARIEIPALRERLKECESQPCCYDEDNGSRADQCDTSEEDE